MKIELNKLEKEDIELVRKWRNSKEVSSYMYSSNDITKKNQENWFNNLSKDKTCGYWIISYQSKKIGLVYLTDINLTLSSCYWAFYLGDTSVRGAGIGGKVEYKMLEYVFEVLNLNKLRCEVFTFNANVIRMHEKFGFRREAYYREHCYKNDKWEDVIGLAITKKEWNILKNKLYEKVYKKN